MRRLFLLVVSCFVMSAVFAPAAMAQTVFPESDGSGATIGDGCPAGQFGAIPAGTVGESGFACFDTEQEAAIYAETGVSEDNSPITQEGADLALPNADGSCPAGFVTTNAGVCAEESPNTPGRIFGFGEGDLASDIATDDAGSAQYADDTMANLPDTGGLPLGGLAAIGGISLIAGGLLLRHRLS